MPRQSEYSADEDAIIMAGAGEHADVTNARLVEAGFMPRTPRQLTNRRQHLKRHGFEQPGTDVELLVRRIKKLQARRAQALQVIADSERELEELGEQLRAQADEILKASGVS